MIKVGTGFSKNLSLEKAAFEAATRALDEGGISKADTVLVFATLKKVNGWAGALKKIKALTGARVLAGGSAYGVLTDQFELERRPSVAVMAFEGLKNRVASYLFPHLQENNFRAGANLAGLLQQSNFNPSLSVIFPDSFSFRHGDFFDGLESENGFTPVIGGSASEPGGGLKTFQWEGDRLSFDSVAGLSFSEDFEFEIGITQSCQPLGEPLQITRSRGNLIYEMEGRPAYDIFLELITQLHFDDSREVFSRLFLGLPVTSFQTEFSRAQYLIRNIMSVNARKGAMTCASPVEEGDYITFALRDPDRAREDLLLTLEDLKQRAGGRIPSFGLYFNCCARGTSLYGTSGEDTSLIREYFPAVPFSGFFTYGEIGPVAGTNHLHHYSGILALAFEK